MYCVHNEQRERKECNLEEVLPAALSCGLQRLRVSAEFLEEKSQVPSTEFVQLCRPQVHKQLRQELVVVLIVL